MYLSEEEISRGQELEAPPSVSITTAIVENLDRLDSDKSMELEPEPVPVLEEAEVGQESDVEEVIVKSTRKDREVTAMPVISLDNIGTKVGAYFYSMQRRACEFVPDFRSSPTTLT